MLSSRNNTKTSAVAFIALLTLSAVVAILPAFAQKTYTKMPERDTGTYVAASPKLLGLGQEVTINIFTWPAPSGPTYYAQNMVNVQEGWEDLSCTITKPDGTKDTFMPTDVSLEHSGQDEAGKSTIVGSLLFYYKPTAVGNYSISASFPGQTFTTDTQYANLNLSVYYKPSATTKLATWTVQEDIVLSGLLNGYPWSALPTGFWTTPTSINNREWSAISGDWIAPKYNNWLYNYNPYSTAPTTPHIIWANQIQTGGLVGGDWGSLGINGIQNAWTQGPLIYSGFLYQNDLIGGTYSCWNLYTGQLMWRNTGAIAQVMRISPAYQTAAQANEGGILAWLWDFSTAGQWKRIDPYTGQLLQTITNVPTTQGLVNVAGLTPGATNAVPTGSMEDGNPITYVAQFGGWNTTIPLKFATEYLVKWNYSKLVPNLSGTSASNNWLSGVVWNVSIRQPDGQGIGDGRGSIRVYPFESEGVVVVRAHDDEQIMMGFDMQTGARLWTNNNTVLDIAVGMSPFNPIIICDGATNKLVAYSVKTGQEIWRVSPGEEPWSAIPDMTFVFDDNIFYYGSYDGHVYAVNAQTGEPVWTSDFSGANDETVYGVQPFNGASVGANGILYYSTYSTYANNPRPRFMELIAINQTTGHFLWRLPIGINPECIAYGVLVGRSGQDGMQYAIGKGPSATTVSAAQQIGGSMLIQGSVMDKSPGRQSKYGGADSVIPSPAVSDASMSEWMAYLYGQNATLINNPPTPTGVQVTLTAVDPTGKSINIGTTTSDSLGHFGYQWNPTTAGLYTIYATFAGSGGYYGSAASTSATIGSAAETPNTQPPDSAPDNSTLLYGILAAVVVAILIGLVALFRKH